MLIRGNHAGHTFECPVCGRTLTMGYGHKVGFQVSGFQGHIATCRDVQRVADEHGVSLDEGRKIRRRERRKELAAMKRP